VVIAPERETPLTAGVTAGLHGRLEAGETGFCRRSFRVACPPLPGVYALLDAAGNIVYVGKSRCLRARLGSYLRARDLSEKAGRMMTVARTIVWEVLPDELASRLREVELIRALKPRYNVQYNPARKRRGYLVLTSELAPRVLVSVEKPARAACLMAVGPLPSRRRLERAAQLLNDLLQLQTCPTGLSLSWQSARERPGCLRYELRECLGPCVGATSAAVYQAQVERARSFLLGKDLTLLHELQARMQVHAEALAFERAAFERDRWQLLRSLVRKMRWLRRTRRNFDFVYPLASATGATTWYLLRGGQVSAALPEPKDAPAADHVVDLIGRVYAADGARQRRAWPDSLGGENLALVARWFREHPDEKARLLRPAEALARCRRTEASPGGS
jgi:excinuclease UvrABC nuclease subunit